MNWKKELALSLASAFLSGLACVIYDQIYSRAFYVNFSKIINIRGIMVLSIIGCLLMSIGYILLIRWKGNKLIPWANVVYGVFSFASIVAVLSFKLPLDMESPELFPGLATPMHFFPVLSFLIVYPFFKINNQIK
ncbi:hypothetical protein ACPPVU_04300 [Mucilaginibacter sp. McL0603]|uniref:hypothetical protein n=1 Tax=Mucilaginibacter sp. McL0603 TaxID=3415670 RepID=UPI003CF0E03F